jgi:transposase
MTVTVFSGRERRRPWTSAEKLRIVEESLVAETSVIEIARRHDVHPNQLHAWRREARLGILGSGVAAVAQTECRFVPIAVAAEVRVFVSLLRCCLPESPSIGRFWPI